VIKLKDILFEVTDNGIEWDYLLSEPYKARNYLAAAWAKDSNSILEVGGYKNPIYQFYNDQNAKLITNVDPKGETFEKNIKIGSKNVKISSYGEKLEDVKNLDPDTVIALGLAIPSRESFEALKNYSKNANTIILEGAINWPQTVKQMNEIIEEFTISQSHHIIADIILDFSNSNVKTLNTSQPVYDKRRFVVLKGNKSD
jgi:hypothetical protein